MNQVNGTAWIAVGLLAGIGVSAVALVGSQMYQSSDQSSQVPEAQPVASSVASPAAVQQTNAQQNVEPSPAAAPVAAPAQPIAFEQLSPCDQLDSLARAGKSVSEFLVAAHRVNNLAKYQAAIGSACPWNSEQLVVADRIINPPVVVQPQVTRQVSGSSASRTVIVQERPAPAWNNCNGVQEPGESYSARCETAQEMNDAGVGNRWSERVDNRPLDPSGTPDRQGPPIGYSREQ